jgi:hypothetical protein
MSSCSHCQEDADIFYECNYCGGIYCPDHRLPEGHGCDGVEFLSWNQEWVKRKSVTRNFRSIEADDTTEKEDAPSSTSDRESVIENPGDGPESMTRHRPFRNKSTDEIISSRSDFDTPEPITPELTVGTTPEPEFDSSPPVRVTSDAEGETSRLRSVLGQLRNWGRKLLQHTAGLFRRT